MEKGKQVVGRKAAPSVGRKPIEGWGALVRRKSLEAPPDQVATRLLGKILLHRTGGKVLAGRIVEIEAYLGPHHDPPDPAAHAHRGPTPRNLVLFGPAGFAYVYAIYGRYFCMNVSCETEGQAGSVLLRALEPLAGQAEMARNRGLEAGASACQLTSGPSRLCQALGLTRAEHNGLNLLGPTSPLQLWDDGFTVSKVQVSARIGINVAVDWPLRFSVPDHTCVSGPRRIQGHFIFPG